MDTQNIAKQNSFTRYETKHPHLCADFTITFALPIASRVPTLNVMLYALIGFPVCDLWFNDTLVSVLCTYLMELLIKVSAA